MQSRKKALNQLHSRYADSAWLREFWANCICRQGVRGGQAQFLWAAPRCLEGQVNPVFGVLARSSFADFPAVGKNLVLNKVAKCADAL